MRVSGKPSASPHVDTPVSRQIDSHRDRLIAGGRAHGSLSGTHADEPWHGRLFVLRHDQNPFGRPIRSGLRLCAHDAFPGVGRALEIPA